MHRHDRLLLFEHKQHTVCTDKDDSSYFLHSYNHIHQAQILQNRNQQFQVFQAVFHQNIVIHKHKFIAVGSHQLPPFPIWFYITLLFGDNTPSAFIWATPCNKSYRIIALRIDTVIGEHLLNLIGKNGLYTIARSALYRVGRQIRIFGCKIKYLA